MRSCIEKVWKKIERESREESLRKLREGLERESRMRKLMEKIGWETAKGESEIMQREEI